MRCPWNITEYGGDDSCQWPVASDQWPVTSDFSDCSSDHRPPNTDPVMYRFMENEVAVAEPETLNGSGAAPDTRTLISMHLEKTLKSDRVLRDLRRHA